MIGVDADHALRRTYGIHGWPAWVVIDQQGIVQFHGHDSDHQLSGLRRCLEQLLASSPSAPGPSQIQEGIAFPPEVLAARQAQRERSPRLALDTAGKPYVVYYSNREGANAVYLRHFNQQGEAAGDERLSPANGEAYAADCAFDPQGTLWVTWCGRHSRFYDIFVLSRQGGQPPVLRRLTASDDDAMSPKIAASPDGTVTVTYYKWAKMGGVSRDRNIFARRFDPARRAWSEEVEVSPPEPAVEDHTDPDVVIDRQGGAWVVWSYDYHPSLYKHPVAAAEPTIFAARVGSNAVTAPLVVGATGQFRNAIDLFPSAAIDSQGAVWCAWDCSEPQRCIRLARLVPPADAFTPVNAFGGQNCVCSTPELSYAAGGKQLLLAWSQRTRGGFWQGKAVLLASGQALKTATFTENADVLFPQAQQGADGRFWVAYERSGPKGSQLVLRNLTHDFSN